jgi:dephospho-CoA kinase
MAGFLKIGLTGGIATGKSAVLNRWRAAGAIGIETDELAHQALAPGTATHAAVVAAFGPGILRPDGAVDRRQLGELVFADEQRRLALNQIIHPAVRRRWTAEVADLAARGNRQPVVVCIPLLYEVGAEAEFDAVVAVACSEPVQLARLATRHLTPDQARARVRAQWPLSRKCDRADYVIWNDGSLAVLEQQTDIVWEQLKEHYHAPSAH